jgi:hypothetical protein
MFEKGHKVSGISGKRVKVYAEIRTKKGLKTVALTPKLAIRYNCQECMGFETDPWDCTHPHCALFLYRPHGQRAKK